MDSTVMRSPPTSRAIAARSSVVVMTLGFPCACAIDAMSVIANAAAHVDWMNFMTTPQVLEPASERMRTVCTDGKLELEEKLVRRIPGGVLRPAVLAAHLAELARPIRQHERSPRVVKRLIVGVSRPVVAGTGVPAARELVVTGHEEAERILLRAGLLATAPDQLRAADEGSIDGSLQRPPPQRGVHAVELSREPAEIDVAEDARCVVPVGE